MTLSILGGMFHQATISATVLDSTGKLVMTCDYPLHAYKSSFP